MKRKYLITLSVVIGLCAITTGGYFLTQSKEANTDVSAEIDDFAGNESIQTDEKGLLSPYTGMVLPEDASTQDSFMAIIENSRQARPQSGLSQSDFIYEVMTEGGITRFMALFNSNYSEKIGPIRSARYYFLDLAKEFDLPFLHCGGSYDATETIDSDSSLKSINEMVNGSYFSRDAERVAPHNLYTSTENIEKLLDTKTFNETKMRKLTFNDDYWSNESLENCLSLDLKLSNYYSTSYKYSESGYIKSMDGTEAIDDTTNEPLIFDNIVIQLTNIKNRETEEYMDIDLVGSGDAIVISNGQYVKGTWNKKDSSVATTITDANGKIIPLSTGNTIWHIADTTNEIKIY